MSNPLQNLQEAYLDMYSEEKKPFPTRRVGDKLNNLEAQWIKAFDKEKEHKGMERYTSPEAIQARKDQQKIADRQHKINKVAKANNPLPPRRRRVEEEFIIDYLLDEGFVNNEVSAEVFIEHMSDEWLDSILEAACDQSNKQIEKGVKTTYKAGNVLDNLHQGRSPGMNKLPATERRAKEKRMRGRLKTRRDDLFGERNKREDEERAEMKKRFGV